MKRNLLLKLIIAVATIAITNVHANAINGSNHTILLKKELKYDSWDPEVEGHRVPSRPIPCVITQDGIKIEGVETSEICLIEVIHTSDEKVFTFNTESEFIKFLFSTDSEIEVHFHTSNYVFIGYL